MRFDKLLISGLFLTAVSQQAFAKEWSLQECIDYALENNLSIKLREQDLVSGQLNVEESRNAFLPRLSGSVGQSFNFGR